MMKLSVSNIAWAAHDDALVYEYMRERGFSGLEIAPTRLFPDAPYERAEEARRWKEELHRAWGLSVCSMQSIWYGRTERLFGSEEERQALKDYTKKAIDFAEALGCGNLVFGCPKNRVLPADGEDGIALSFFRELGEYAAAHHTVLAVEANPPLYGTNFLNTTREALDFVERVGSAGCMLNLDLGTMIENGEMPDVLAGREELIHHVHISEPSLRPLRERELHRQLAALLRGASYGGYVSIEVGRQEDPRALASMMDRVREIFR